MGLSGTRVSFIPFFCEKPGPLEKQAMLTGLSPDLGAVAVVSGADSEGGMDRRRSSARLQRANAT